MIAVDTNILVYAHRADSPWNQRAYECLDFLASSAGPWLLPWTCLHEFLGIVTHSRIYRPPTSLAGAIRQIEFWLASPSVLLGAESASYWSVLRTLLESSKLSGGLIHDARVAAVCIENAVEVLWTADRDFSRFPSLRTLNPLLTDQGRKP